MPGFYKYYWTVLQFYEEHLILVVKQIRTVPVPHINGTRILFLLFPQNINSSFENQTR
jgi:hypothetical protein